jgi:hypothetical protein
LLTMSTENPLGVSVATHFASRVPPSADSAQIADAVFVTWSGIDAVLVPIIGKRGLAALYKRSVHVTAQAHPWLSVADDVAPAAADFSELTPLLCQQSAAAALAGATALFSTFHDLLSSVVGPSLTERLMRPVWVATSSDSAAKDPKP